MFVVSEYRTGFTSLFGTCNFEVAAKCLKNLCVRGLRVFGKEGKGEGDAEESEF